LEAYLEKENTSPAVIFVHHTLDDGDNSLLDSDRLLRMAAKHRQVKAIFYGHSHRYSFDTYEGVHLVNIPAVGYNFNPDQPVGWVDAKFAPGGVDLRLHAVGGEMALNGKTRSLAWRS
jgi:3',5'-cyclic AMP phosphodiesterase CpdA